MSSTRCEGVSFGTVPIHIPAGPSYHVGAISWAVKKASLWNCWLGLAPKGLPRASILVEYMLNHANECSYRSQVELLCCS